MNVQDMNNYYKAIINKETKLSRQVGWRDDIAQIRRFEQLFYLLKNEEKIEVADLGCGLSGFYNFLTTKNKDFQYTGYDISPDMINKAKLINNSSNIDLRLINETSDISSHDFIVLSGIFNMKKDIDNNTWQEYILKQLDIIHQKSMKGFAFNLLTIYSDKDLMKEELFYAEPSFFFDYCKKNFSKNIALMHDYDEYDFTIIVRK